MITFYGANEKLTNEVLALKSRYPNDIDISNCFDNNDEIPMAPCGLKRITISSGIPVILKYYDLDNKFRIEIGSYLSDLITNLDYIYIVIA